jgi:hypothetical protein
MKVTLIKEPAFPGISTNKISPRFLLLGMGAASAESSSRLNHLIATVSPYEEEIADFDHPPGQETQDEPWTEAKNQRRCDLINRKYERGLTPGENRELAHLQNLMQRHRRRVAPLPIEDVRRQYEELLARVRTSRAPTDS